MNISDFINHPFCLFGDACAWYITVSIHMTWMLSVFHHLSDHETFWRKKVSQVFKSVTTDPAVGRSVGMEININRCLGFILWREYFLFNAHINIDGSYAKAVRLYPPMTNLKCLHSLNESRAVYNWYPNTIKTLSLIFSIF